MSRWEGLDRRRFPRVNYPCLIVIRNNEGQTKEAVLAHTDNVGIGGVCVLLKKSIDIFSPVEIELDLLDLSSHIKCKGKVVWNVQRKMDAQKKAVLFDIGIEFQELDPKERERLEQVVQRLVQTTKEVY